jgi:Na+/proline symporter
MIIGVVLMVFFFMNHENVGWDLSELTSNPNLNWFTFDSTSTGLYGSTVSLISLILLTSFGVWALPQTVHKYHSIRDKKAITQGTIISTVFALIIGFGAYFTGALSGLFPEVGNIAGDLKVPHMLNIVIPTGLMGIIAVLVLSASMSTLSSVSLASASVVAVDLYKGKINQNASDKKVNLVMRVLCLVFIVISVVLAILNEKFHLTAIAYLMGLSWGTLAGCFMGPYVLGVIWKRVTRPACWASIISSLVLTVGLLFLFGYHKNGFDCSFGTAIQTGVTASPLIGVICMAFSLVITTVVSLLTKKPSKETLTEAFDKPIENEV